MKETKKKKMEKYIDWYINTYDSQVQYNVTQFTIYDWPQHLGKKNLVDIKLGKNNWQSLVSIAQPYFNNCN